MSQMILFLLLNATLQTIYMVVAASFIAVCLGLPLGVILYITRRGNLLAQPLVHHLLAAIVNVTRSIPFIILMIAVIPITRFLVGSSIGTAAAIVPLSFAALPFVARIVDNALLEVDTGLIEAAEAMGATSWQTIIHVLLPEAFANIVNGITLTIINLIGYSAMAGAVGGGGLGDMAVRYGYQRFNSSVMLMTIVMMVILVQAIQFFGDKIAKRVSHNKLS